MYEIIILTLESDHWYSKLWMKASARSTLVPIKKELPRNTYVNILRYTVIGLVFIFVQFKRRVKRLLLLYTCNFIFLKPAFQQKGNKKLVKLVFFCVCRVYFFLQF
jgi:hypothetical protein